jgi:hypothetical protein
VGVSVADIERRVLVPYQRALLDEVAHGAVVTIRSDVVHVEPASWAALVGSTLAPSWPWAWVSSMARSSRSPSLFARVLMEVLLWSPAELRDILRHQEGRRAVTPIS